ncbi:hypothetical protein ACQ4LE_003159 [Meloidogyne hapla]
MSLKTSSRSRSHLIRFVDCICSSILQNDLSIADLLEDVNNQFYLNNENEKVPIPMGVVVAFRRLYLKLKSEISALNGESSNNEEVDIHLLHLLGPHSLAKLTYWPSQERRKCSTDSHVNEIASSDSTLTKADGSMNTAAPKQLKNHEQASKNEATSHKLGLEFVEAVSISPRLPLTSTVYTQTNGFEKSKNMFDVSIQAAMPLIEQATSPVVISNEPKSLQLFEDLPNGDKSVSTLFTPSSSSNIQQSTDLSSSGQLDETKAISLLSRHGNRAVVYNISSDGGIVTKQPKTKSFVNSSISSGISNTDCDDEVESISICDLRSKNKELIGEDGNPSEAKNSLAEKTSNKEGTSKARTRIAETVAIRVDEEEEPSTLNQITPIPNNFELSS